MFTKGKIPFVRFLIPLITGITIGYFWPAKWMLEWAPAFLFPILSALGLFVGFYKRMKLYQVKWLAGVFMHCFLLLIGCFLTVKGSGKFTKAHFSNQKADAMIVAIKTEPRLSNGFIRLEAEVIKVLNNQAQSPATGSLLIALKTDSLRPVVFDYGQVIVIPGRFSELDPPYNPAEFDYKQYLADHRIYHQAFFDQNQIVVLPRKAGNAIITFAIQLRQRLILKFKTFLPDRQAASLAATLILGYRSELDKDIVDAYSKTGTMHVLSVSGMHVGIVFIVLAFILKPLNRNRYLRFFSACIIVGLIWFYALVTGFSPSVCRAAVMLTFIVLGKSMKKNQNTYNLIAISAFVLLLYNPYYLFDVGFQLSYLAVVGLVFFHPKIYHLLYIRHWLPDNIWSYCALSLAAQLATFPLSVYYFHQFPVYFLLSNLFIVLPVIVIMYGGILFLFITSPVILQPLGELLNFTIQTTNAILFYIENLPFSTLNGIWLTTFQYLMLYAIMSVVICAILSKNGKAVLISLSFILILCCSLAYNKVVHSVKNEIIFYSLRKNTAVAYITNGNALIMTDLNQSDKTIPFSIEPYLTKSNVVNKVYSDIASDCKGISNRNFIKLGSYKILRWDKTFDKKIFKYPIAVDALVLTGNTTLNLDRMNPLINYSLLLIDGTNSDYRINAWTEQAEKLHINFHVLKKKPAYIVRL